MTRQDLAPKAMTDHPRSPYQRSEDDHCTNKLHQSARHDVCEVGKCSTEPIQGIEAQWVNTADQLQALALQMVKAPWIAIDTESNSMFAYRERVCLIQLNVGGTLYFVDPIALGEIPEDGPAAFLNPLKSPLEDPEKTTFVHGGEYDVATLSRDFGIFLGGIFDSQQAAQFLGWEKTGYGALVERICGIKLPKDQAQYNWQTRPINQAALAYAENDVRYLPKICTFMRQQVEEAGLVEELEIALKAVEAMRWHGGFSPKGFWRLKDTGKLSETQLRRLFALYCLRDELAKQANRPSGQMINERVLVAMTLHPPKTTQDLRACGVRSATIGLHGDRLLQVTAHPEQVPGGFEFPHKAPHPIPDDREQKRESRLREWRQKEAARRKVPLAVVLPSTALMWLKAHGASDLAATPQLGNKRLKLYAEVLQKLCK